MLQQTQVDRVMLFYRRWLKAFPNWKRLANATNAQVLRAWSGLGYNRRALALRDIAREVLRSGVPKTPEDWHALKGIGAYTAAAVSAFAQDAHVMPIDTNIRRVLDRVLLGLPFPKPSADKRLLKRMDDFLPRRGRHADVPQALFDLATMICKKEPACAKCPLRKDCKAATKFLSGRIKTPNRLIKKSNERHHDDKPFPNRIYRGRILKIIHKHGRMKPEHIGPLIDPTFNLKQDLRWLRDMITKMRREGLL